MDQQKQKQNAPFSSPAAELGKTLSAPGVSKGGIPTPKEVESINGYYKKVVVETTDAAPYQLTELGKKVFDDRYSLKDERGVALEHAPEEMWSRVARTIAAVEATSEKARVWEEQFYWVLSGFKFVPAGRILTGAGAKTEVTFYNCYVLPYPEDSRGGIMESVTIMMEIMARGGGVGVNLSSLRPCGSYVRGVNGRASGAVSFGALYSFVTGLIEQGGSRRGALMLMLNDDHPDIEEFITVKRTMGKVTNANLSVCVSDRFMEAVKNDADWDLVWGGKVLKTLKAAKLWDLITESAHASGEPGCVFMERCNKESNTWYFEDIISVNPCGEQPLPAWGVCNLGAINLVPFAHEGIVDWENLGKTVRIAMRFADNVVDATPYAYEENRRAQMNVRRTGLGTMGLGDFLIKMRVRYGSDEAVALAEKVYRFLRDESYRASVEIAKEKGSFPDFDREKYLQGVYIQRLPEDIRAGIAQYGIRNGVLQTQAPTGTTSLLAGVSSGIEPVYDFSFKRKDRIGEHIVYHQLYREYVEERPGEPIPDYFVNAKQLTPLEHVKMQAVIQKYTDASISKTVNAPESHTHEDVKELYLKAYELGCKGVTYFRENSRDVSVLESLDVAKKKEATVSEQASLVHREPKPRPEAVSGKTYKVKTAYGSLYVTVNEDESGAPFEVFAQIGKAGGFFNAKSEAICRMVSLALRSGIRAEEIISQLKGIRGPMPSFGTNGDRFLSLPDAIAKVLERHIAGVQGTLLPKEVHAAHQMNAQSQSIAEFGHAPECPQCGGVLEMGEGCQLCRSCGFSKC